jgi:hypothetical protein
MIRSARWRRAISATACLTWHTGSGRCCRTCSTPTRLGTHARPCIRWPMLRVNPKMLEANLLNRRERAEAGGWADEIDGIDLTSMIRGAKRSEAQRHAQQKVDLGIPTLEPPPRRAGA